MDDVRYPINRHSERFMDRFRLYIRTRHLAYRTEKTYCYWVLKYIRFHDRKNPTQMGAREVEDFLEYLSTQRCVAANTQKTALNALSCIKNFSAWSLAIWSALVRPLTWWN